MRSWLTTGTLGVLSFSVLAFGGVYRWAYVPAGALSLLIGLVALSKFGLQRDLKIVACAVLAVIGAAAAQLTPLPVETVRLLNPSGQEAFRILYIEAAVTGRAQQTLSIDPVATRVALFLLVVLSTFALGMSGALDRGALIWTARGVTGLSVVLVVIAVWQGTSGASRIYGLWSPISANAEPFGPFVNRNHFAGWMLMALPLTLGYFSSRLASASRLRLRGWRARAIWFSSKEASETLLTAGAAIVMAVGLALTGSRSGIVGLIGESAALTILLSRRLSSSTSRLVAIGYFALLAIGSVGWVGVEAVADRFAVDGSWLGIRQEVWGHSWPFAYQFALTGSGLNTFGTLMLAYPTPGSVRSFSSAHNDYLQLAIEGGALVGLPLLLTAAALVVRIRERLKSDDRSRTVAWIRVGALVGIAGIAIQESVDFSLQIPANSLLFALVVGIAACPPAMPGIHGKPAVTHLG